MEEGPNDPLLMLTFGLCFAQLPATIDKFAKEEIETPNHSKP